MFKFLKETVIPLEEIKGGVPGEPPLSLPSPPKMGKMGMTSELALSFKTADDSKLDEFKSKARKERDDREAAGRGDRWSEMQPSVMPKMDELEGVKIEMLFEAIDADGNAVLEWSHGEVTSVLNSKTRRVEIEWDDDCVHPDDWASMKITKDRLLVLKWNPTVAVKGAWRLYLK